MVNAHVASSLTPWSRAYYPGLVPGFPQGLWKIKGDI
jgi:hypothetical protein